MANVKLYETSISTVYKGEYSTTAQLIAAYPKAELSDYAYINETNSYWYWNSAITINEWVNQQITEFNYLSLSAEEKAAVPYIVGV